MTLESHEHSTPWRAVHLAYQAISSKAIWGRQTPYSAKLAPFQFQFNADIRMALQMRSAQAETSNFTSCSHMRITVQP